MEMKITRINLQELKNLRIQIPESKKTLEFPIDDPLNLDLKELQKDDLIYEVRELQKQIQRLKEKNICIEFDLEEV